MSMLGPLGSIVLDVLGDRFDARIAEVIGSRHRKLVRVPHRRINAPTAVPSVKR